MRASLRCPPGSRSGRLGGPSEGRLRRLATIALALEAMARSSDSGSVSGAPAVRASRFSALEPGGCGHHRCAPGVDGGDDLFGVDALEVDRGRAEVGVAELALDLPAASLPRSCSRFARAKRKPAARPPDTRPSSGAGARQDPLGRPHRSDSGRRECPISRRSSAGQRSIASACADLALLASAIASRALPARHPAACEALPRRQCTRGIDGGDDVLAFSRGDVSCHLNADERPIPSRPATCSCALADPPIDRRLPGDASV